MDSNHNQMTRHEFLRRILQSGEVTRIAQHLALTIVVLAEDGQFKASARDLERMTGWSKSMIADHLAELEIFMKVTLGIGRGKSMFELQGVIEDALNKAIVVGSQEPVASATRTQEQISVPLADATADTKSYVRMKDAIADMSATRTQEHRLASATRTQQVPEPKPKTAPCITTRATKESPTEIVITKKKMGTGQDPDPILVNCNTISGPGFVISLGAVDMEASLRGLPVEFARKKAEAMARQWAATGKPPHSPDATIARALREEANATAVQGVRLEKVKGKPSRADPEAERKMAAAFDRARLADEEIERCRKR
jgi:hypothetical protein